MTLWPLYGAAARAATPLIKATLAYRSATGKEDPRRIQERWGRAGLRRPPGSLVWFHAASVGESLSLLPLLNRVLDARPGLSAVVTTVTTTSARVLADRLPAGRAWHQYSPVDHPGAIRRFLEHWSPDIAVWVESELWPNLILVTRSRGIPMALLNARLSEQSWRGWKRFPGHIGALLGSFDLVLAQDRAQADRLRDLGATHADSVGNLKAEPSRAIDPATTRELAAMLGERPRWLAASTHAGEEEIVLEAHRRVRQRFPDALTVLAPRHPARTAEVVALIEAAGMTLARRSIGEPPGPDTDIWLIDTLGELASFYPVAPIILIAGSFGVPGSLGGHNPAEAAALGAAILHGPDMANSAEFMSKLDRAGAAIPVGGGEALAEAVMKLLADAEFRHRIGEAAAKVAAAGRGVSEAAFARLEPLLPPLVQTMVPLHRSVPSGVRA